MTRNEVAASHMQLKEGFQYPSELDKERVRTLHKDPTLIYHGYWAVVSERMGQIFEAIDWKSFCGLSEEDIETSVCALGETKFAGAFGEAERMEARILKTVEKEMGKKAKNDKKRTKRSNKQRYVHVVDACWETPDTDELERHWDDSDVLPTRCQRIHVCGMSLR
jgi:hypothetical protein